MSGKRVTALKSPLTVFGYHRMAVLILGGGGQWEPVVILYITDGICLVATGMDMRPNTEVSSE